MLATGAGAIGLIAGVMLPIEKLREISQPQSEVATFGNQTGVIGAPSTIVSPLVSQSPTQREPSLKTVARKSDASLERNRARYLLASDLIGENQGDKALEQLKDLEKDYAVLTPQILLKRAQAYNTAGKSKDAIATLQDLIKRFPKEAATAESLFLLGRNNGQYWDQLINQFPAHPRSVEVAKTRLKQNPKQLPLLLIVAKYGVETDGYTNLLDRLSTLR